MTKKETQFDWNEQSTTRLVDMYVEGKTASQIARELGYGLTRNAIIGKLGRLRAKGIAPRLPESTITFKRLNSLKSRPVIINPWKRAPLNLVAPPKPSQPEKPRMAIVTRNTPETQPEPPTGVWNANLTNLRPKACRWVVESFTHGGGDEAKMCGEAQEDGSSYCRFHRKMGTIPNAPAKKKFRHAVGHR